jgi:ankyrin repeat protein
MVVTSLGGCNSSHDESLFQAIRAKDTRSVERILRNNDITLDPPRRAHEINKPLAFAAAYGNLDIVKIILMRGADIDGTVAYGDVPLIKAAEHGNKDIIMYLIEQGADVNKPNDFGISPFIGFCAAQPVEVVEAGLKHGGKINVSFVSQIAPNKGEQNYTALQAAAASGRVDVVRTLLAHGGDPSIRDANGKTSVDLAREKGHNDIVQLLIDAMKKSHHY